MVFGDALLYTGTTYGLATLHKAHSGLGLLVNKERVYLIRDLVGLP